MATEHKIQLISLVIPAYSEEKRLPNTLDELAQFLKNNLTKYDIEVIVVVADSPDKTLDVANDYKHTFSDYRYHIVRPGKRSGKGRDVRAGMQIASGDIRIFFDADLATPLHHLNTMVADFENGKDVVIGKRKLSTIHSSSLRSFVSQLGNISSKVFVNVYYEDTQCGFKGFTAHATDVCFGRQTILGWGFDIELLAIAKIYNLKVGEIVISDWEDKAGGSLTGNVVASSLRTLKELIIIKRNLNAGKYR